MLQLAMQNPGRLVVFKPRSLGQAVRSTSWAICTMPPSRTISRLAAKTSSTSSVSAGPERAVQICPGHGATGQSAVGAHQGHALEHLPSEQLLLELERTANFVGAGLHDFVREK